MMKTEMLLYIGVLLLVTLPGCSAKRPRSLGVKEGMLSPCPESPNCVSSMASDKEHFIEPFRFSISPQQARRELVRTIHSMKRAAVITEKEEYIHAEFTSALFRFVDDVEFYINGSEKLIHVRSASRVGYSDMGVNRKRIESIRRVVAGILMGK